MSWKRCISGAMAGVLLAAGSVFSVAAQPSGALERGSLYRQMVNLDHLNHLQDEVVLGGREMAVTRIYSEYPDYGWVDAGEEGIGCVDDTARAAVVYLTDFERTGDRKSLERARKSLNFVLHMQAEDGEFYNFVREDYSINRDGPTSRKSMSWWASRAMWALGHGYRVFRKEDPVYAAELKERFLLANEALQRKMNPDYGKYRWIHGKKVPAWIDEFDAFSNALLGLTEYYRADPLPEIADSMVKLGDGLSQYQLGTFSEYPYHAHMDWSGSIQLWHAWGSSQPMALARAGKVLNRRDYIESARKAAEGIYAHLLTSGMIKEMAPTPSYYEQIAYGANRMVQGLIALGEATGDAKYQRMAGLAASWFFGNNSANAVMYDVRTGRGYDGIVGPEEINRNAGAESTIEALMAVQATTWDPHAAQYLRADKSVVHSYRIYEAEQAEAVSGSPKIVTPESPWTGESLYSGRLVKMRDGDALRFVVDHDRAETVQLEAVFERQAELKGRGSLTVIVNGREVARHDTGGSPDSDYLWREAIRRVKLKRGENRILLAYRGERPLILDNLVVQPVRSFAVYRLPEKGKVILYRNLEKERNILAGGR